MSTPEIDRSTAQLDETETYRLGTRAAKGRCLVGLLLLAVVMGVFDQLVEHEWSDRVLTLAGMLLGIVLITTGCQHDSREWSYTITKPLRLLLIFIAIIGVPIYLLRTRGLRGLISIAMAVAFFGILLLLEQLAIAITDRVECLLTK